MLDVTPERVVRQGGGEGCEEKDLKPQALAVSGGSSSEAAEECFCSDKQSVNRARAAGTNKGKVIFAICCTVAFRR